LLAKIAIFLNILLLKWIRKDKAVTLWLTYLGPATLAVNT
jgi:hypothetical protein